MSANNVPVPVGVTFALNRSWDYTGGTGSGCAMNHINPSSGTFFWTAFDTFFSNNTTKDLIFELGLPADYLITRAAIGGASYGGKSNMCPDDLTTWAAAVTTVVSRAKNTWGRTGLKWELWNEIDQAGFYGDPISLLGPYTKATVQAILAVDPTATIIAPSIAGGAANEAAFLASYLAASDGAGGTAKQWVNGIAYHSYENYSTGPTGGQYSPTNLLSHWNIVQATQKAAGLNLPTWVTESGYSNTEPQQAIDLIRNMMFAAAIGAQCYLGYTYDNTFFSISGVAAQWNAAAALLRPGAVISSLVLGAYALQVTIDGIAYTF